MKNLLILFTCLCLAPPTRAQQTYWQQQLEYTIEVTLNDQDHSLDGFLRLKYQNNSPDTLRFIWFHLWPNAYKNDRTAFSEQLLEQGRTDFYFSSRENRGYINRLDFRSNNNTLRVEDHPAYIDIVKVVLEEPLAPKQAVTIQTPFHVKLPYRFSRSGHIDQSYNIAQWYPKPAVYDQAGWHPMPYLDQGEFYAEFANYDVRITLPANYVVAATGQLQQTAEKDWLKNRKQPPALPSPPAKQKFLAPAPKKETLVAPIASATATKTLQYLQNNAHDFAWFASKYFGVRYDTVILPSGKAIEAWAFFTARNQATWEKSIDYIRNALVFRSSLLGDYPYQTAVVVETAMGFQGGMEYPGITSISPTNDPEALDGVIEHELGHNWFYGALASNERQYPWLDEGLNTYYDERYKIWKQKKAGLPDPPTASHKLPADQSLLVLNMLAAIKKDQAITTPAAEFTELNYAAVAYSKTALWLKEMEEYIGQPVFDSLMRLYYSEWKFKHPQPADFWALFENNSPRKLDHLKQAQSATHQLLPATQRRTKVKPALLYNFTATNSTSYINFAPLAGINAYDGFMLGLLVHNYNPPANRFRFYVAPLFGFASKELNGQGKISYQWLPDTGPYKIEAGLGLARFSSLKGTDSNANRITGNWQKITPSLRINFRPSSLRSSKEQWLEWKSFFIGERSFEYTRSSVDSLYYPQRGNRQSRYLNQLTYSLSDYRVLYPYELMLQVQQGQDFYRASVTGNYFLNYSSGGGASIRMVATKFGYLGGKTSRKQFATLAYQPKLTAVRGEEDYTYANYFYGRNESDGLASQQIMIRDGGLKLRTDLFQGIQGRSEDWIAAINLNTSLPAGIFPRFIPLRLFFDFGTYAEAWKKDAGTRRFLYAGGIQLSLFKDLVNIYAPLVYSSEFSDNLKTVPEENKFFRKLSFSIDIQRFNIRRLTGNKISL